MKRFAIIVAGGSGTRMKSSLPKQFLLLQGKPILMHTLEAFHAFDNTLDIFVGLPADQIDHWKELCLKHEFTLKHQIIKGGSTRFQTVKSCLSAISTIGLIAIHDGVRPLIAKETIAASFNIATQHGAAVASVRLKESIRRITPTSTEHADRSKFRLIQTPQTFKSDILHEAYALNEEEWMTDDASVVEHAGHSISLFEGSYDNIKITTPSDLTIAEALLNLKES